METRAEYRATPECLRNGDRASPGASLPAERESEPWWEAEISVQLVMVKKRLAGGRAVRVRKVSFDPTELFADSECDSQAYGRALEALIDAAERHVESEA